MGKQTPLTRRVIAALLMALLTACQTWRPTAVSPHTLIPVEQPSSVRATLRSGEIITVWNPTMRNDSIVSARRFAGAAAVSVRDVRLLEVWRTNVAESIGLGLVIAAATFEIFALAWWAQFRPFR
jgi:hypothetical protein